MNPNPFLSNQFKGLTSVFVILAVICPPKIMEQAEVDEDFMVVFRERIPGGIDVEQG